MSAVAIPFTLVAPGNDGVSAYKMVCVDALARWNALRGGSPRGVGIKSGAEGEVVDDFRNALREMHVTGEIVNPDVEKAGAVFSRLHYAGKVSLEEHPLLYCKKCKSIVDRHDAVKGRGKVTVVVVKFPLGPGKYIIVEGPKEKTKEPVGVMVDPATEFLVYKEGRETWYVPHHLKELLRKEMILHGDTYSVTDGQELLEYDCVYEGRGEPRLLAPSVSLHDELVAGAEGETRKTKALYHYEVESTVLKCPQCNAELIPKRVEGFYLRSTDAFVRYPYPMPVAYKKGKGTFKAHVKCCNKCGFTTTNMNMSKCPSCGVTLKQDFKYVHRFLPAGEFAGLMATSFIYVYTDRDLYDSLLPIHAVISSGNPSEGKYLKVMPKVPPEGEDGEVVRAALLLKGRGDARKEDVRKAERVKRKLLDILNYAKVYGLTENVPLSEWIYTVVEMAKEDFRKAMERGRLHRAFDILADLVMRDISRLYMKVIRKEPLPLYVLENLAMLSAPFYPVTSEEIRAKLGVSELRFACDPGKINMEEYRVIREILSIVREIRKIRARNGIPLRAPIKRLVVIPNEGKEDVLLKYRGIIESMCNILTLDVTDEWDEITYDIIPKKDAVGMVYRQWIPKLSILLRMGDPKKIKREIEAGRYVLGIEGLEIRITSDMVEIKEKVPEGYHEVDSTFGKFYVPLTMSDEERELALVAEVARRIASMRHDIDMDYDDLITVTIYGEPQVVDALKRHEEFLAQRVRALEIRYSSEIEEAYVVEWGIGETSLTIGITPMYREQVIKALTTFPHITEGIAESIFDAGYVSIAQFMDVTLPELEQLTGYPRHMARSILMYISSHKKGFPPIQTEEGPACSLCGALLEEGDEYCGACGAPVLLGEEEVKVEEAVEEVPAEAPPPAPPAEEKPPAEVEKREEEVKEEVAPAPEPEKAPAVAEAEAKAEGEVDLDSMGGIYLIMDQKGKKTYELFKKLVRSGREGIIITREYPKRLIKKHSLPDNIKIFWLSNARKQNTIRPKDLEKISIEIDRFLSRGGKVIVLDGIEFLITNNSFLVVLRFIQSLKDLIAIEEGIMLMPIHPEAVKEGEFHMLEKEVDEVL